MKRNARAFWRTVAVAGGLLAAVPAALVAGFFSSILAGIFVAGVASLMCFAVAGFAIVVAAVPPARPPGRRYWVLLGVGIILLSAMETLVAIGCLYVMAIAATFGSWT